MTDQNQQDQRIVQLNRGTEESSGAARVRGPEHEALQAWIGRWINEGHTLDPDGNPGMPIRTSDVYEWAPGGFFVLHTAYGCVGPFSGGAIEIIGYDEAAGRYTSHLFDSQGNVVLSTLTAAGDTWTYQGDTTRATVVFSDADHVQTVVHERTDGGRATYHRSMEVRLVKVD